MKEAQLDDEAKAFPKRIYRKGWSPEEDAELIQLVGKLGTNRKWPTIARSMSTDRTGKQCWERYHNHLKPEISKLKWTDEEDQQIIELKEKVGNKWSHISKQLSGRSDNDVKNRWNFLQRNKMIGNRSNPSKEVNVPQAGQLYFNSSVTSSEVDSSGPIFNLFSRPSESLIGFEEERKRPIISQQSLFESNQKKQKTHLPDDLHLWIDSNSPSPSVFLDMESYQDSESNCGNSIAAIFDETHLQDQSNNVQPGFSEALLYHQPYKPVAHADYTSNTFVPYISMESTKANQLSSDNGTFVSNICYTRNDLTLFAPTQSLAALQHDRLGDSSEYNNSTRTSTFFDPFLHAIKSLKRRKRLSTPESSPRITPRIE